MSRPPMPDESSAFLKRLGAAIREERHAKRLLQVHLGARAGVPGARVGEIERGMHDTSITRVAAVAGALGLLPSELFRRIEIAARADAPTELQRARVLELLRTADPRALDVIARFVQLMLCGR